MPYRWLCAAVWLVIGRLRPSPASAGQTLLRACRRAYAAFNRGDLPVFLSMFDPNVLYDIARVRDWPEPENATGLSGIREMVRNWHSSWDFSFALHELHDLGGTRCLLLGEFKMTGAGSGVPLDHVRWAQIGTIRRGRWIRVENFHGPRRRVSRGRREGARLEASLTPCTDARSDVGYAPPCPDRK